MMQLKISQFINCPNYHKMIIYIDANNLGIIKEVTKYAYNDISKLWYMQIK